MSTDIEAVGSPPGFADSLGEEDPILRTADDRHESGPLPATADPAADHADAAMTARRADVHEKQCRVIAWLEAERLDAVVLGRADSVAWFTSGGDLRSDMGSDLASILLYINRTSRAVVADNVQSARVFEEELAGLGFQLKERPWFDDPSQVIAELGRNKQIATDLAATPPWVDPPDDRAERLRALRWPLTRPERQRLRELGRTLALALEATCRNFGPGETEADVAGHLAHRLVRAGVTPVDLRVAADDRAGRFRRPTFKAAPILRRATISAVGRRHGLCVAATRTVAFGPVEPEVRAQHDLASMVAATCFFFARPNFTVGEVIRRARRIYEKFGHPHEWTLDHQGWSIGYAPREAPLRPDSPRMIQADTALRWCPSVGPTRSEDTIVVDQRGYEVVTEAQDWPMLQVVVKGHPVARPGILERE